MTNQEFRHTLSQVRGKMLGTARSFMRANIPGEDAEDIVQEALAELWQLMEGGYPVRNVEALSVKITKAVCVRHYRRRKPTTSPIDGREFPGGTPASEKVDISEALATRERLFGCLSETQKQYITMRNEQMMSLDEIAAATGHPKASIKSAISQARKKMIEQLKK